jgi:hypothetical protein
MTYRFFGFFLFAAASGVGCSSGSTIVRVDESPDELTLLSIDGREGVRTESKEHLRGYPVLGTVVITDANKKRELMKALSEAIARRPEHPAKCFWPRHVLRAVSAGKTVDYVICFECSNFEQFEGDQKVHYGPINKDAEPLFDKVLQDAGVPVTPKAFPPEKP